ncbi:YicC/YloC family endoribonuclease [Scopulibacillus darangshiensis]|nr:YicC/YloC family endoribonuclease [Scopulibacillus darangshiensis]
MTGYGRAISENQRHRVSVEVKSVNHRYLDISLNIPRQLFYLEDKIKQIIKSSIKRGKLYFYLTVDGESLTSPKVETNWPILEQYIRECQQIFERYPIQNEIGISDLLQLPDLFLTSETPLDAGDLEPLIIKAADRAVKDLTGMRKREGEHIYNDLSERNDTLQKMVLELRDYAPSVKKNYMERLEKHVLEFLQGHADIDEQRLLTEAAVFADKSNIDEELTRLTSHTKQFAELLDAHEPKGRKFDFLIQEMNREVNTIGSKGNDVLISRFVVDIKSELEKIREQVQNVE